jgi:hypothetical protein
MREQTDEIMIRFDPIGHVLAGEATTYYADARYPRAGFSGFADGQCPRLRAFCLQ